MVSSSVEKTIVCPWDMCQHNVNDVCNKTSIVLEIYILDDDREAMVCASFEKEGEIR